MDGSGYYFVKVALPWAGKPVCTFMPSPGKANE